jgi:hypothetical protein
VRDVNQLIVLLVCTERETEKTRRSASRNRTSARAHILAHVTDFPGWFVKPRRSYILSTTCWKIMFMDSYVQSLSSTPRHCLQSAHGVQHHPRAQAQAQAQASYLGLREASVRVAFTCHHPRIQCVRHHHCHELPSTPTPQQIPFECLWLYVTNSKSSHNCPSPIEQAPAHYPVALKRTLPECLSRTVSRRTSFRRGS